MRRLSPFLVALVLAAPAAAHPARSGQVYATPHVGPLAAQTLDPHPYALIELDRARGHLALPLLRRSGATLVAQELRLWRVRTEVARRIIPELSLGATLRRVGPDRPMRRVRTHLEAGDPLLASEYWLQKIGADRVEPPGPGVPVTVIDTGVDLSHPEFAGRPGTVALNRQVVVGADDDHGTAVSSVVAAPANGIGLVGVYPEAILQVWDASPRGAGNLSNEIRGILAAAKRGPSVINLSLGSEEYDPIEEEAVLVALSRGSIVVASSGNEFQEGNPIEYPASLNHVLTVGATDEGDEPAYFSSSSASVDLAAPGQAIPVALPFEYKPSGYGVEDGTSFSSPLVAGAAAWVWTARPELDSTQIFTLLRRSARDIGKRGYDEATGFGLLDIPRALRFKAPEPDPQEPNDDVDQVKPNGLFARGRNPLTTPSRPAAALRARLDAGEDPDDVYRVYVPAGRTVVVFVRGERDVDLEVWGPQTRSVFEEGEELERDLLGSSARRGVREELVRFRNPGTRGMFVYADVFLGKRVRSTSYGFSVRTTTGG
ncbi:MAG: S8 family serine peptidase [Gaiellaceae bacterium]